MLHVDAGIPYNFRRHGSICANGATAALSRPGDCCLHGSQTFTSVSVSRTHDGIVNVDTHHMPSLRNSHSPVEKSRRPLLCTDRYMLLSRKLTIGNPCTTTCNTNRRSHMHGHGPCNIRVKAPQQPCLGVPRCGSLQWVHINS